MDSKCKKCKNSAWCLAKTWREKPAPYSDEKIELASQIVRCRSCEALWFVSLNKLVGSTVSAQLTRWEMRPCEVEEEERNFGYVDTCSSCSEGHPEKTELRMLNGGVCVIHFRHG